ALPWSMWMRSLKEENFSGFSRQNSRENLSDERLRQRVRRFAFPLLEPGRDQTAEIARTLGKKVLRQLRRAALEIALAAFNNCKQLVTFALPLRFSMFAAQSCGEKTQVVRTTEQISQRPQVVGQAF